MIADAGGEGDALAVTAHLDDIGLMVRHVNADGTHIDGLENTFKLLMQYITG
ncbi:MAG: hypothetical protein IJL25_02745 [Clostridia bacterium]|nr:hypothetical protein [Clostridia bacterium]MBR5422500.1 hypothetical protein [Clostridia bacterium]